ncbi:hypothetical protein FO519_009248 [Halicephalobus sp. NKZ332]|nr:hypothetical protein FO519_009248 [Halicephalobus sp. NKZ332]
MLQFHPSAVEKCQKSTSLEEGKKSSRKENSQKESSRKENKVSNSSKRMSTDLPKKNSNDEDGKLLARNGGNVDIELCHIVAFATEADLQVKKTDEKHVDVHFEKVLQEIYSFLQKRITPAQWKDIEPVISEYQKKNVSCSPYSQLLPPKYFRPLMKAVRRAADTGADRSKIKYLVEDYLDRILFTKEFVKEFRKQPPVGEAKVKPMKIAKPEFMSPVLKVTPAPKPLFPILEVW